MLLSLPTITNHQKKGEISISKPIFCLFLYMYMQLQIILLIRTTFKAKAIAIAFIKKKWMDR